MAFATKGSTDRWRRLDLLNLSGVFLVVKAVSKEVSKVTQGSLQGIGDGFFPTLGGKWG